jgi:hypothetical protein
MCDQVFELMRTSHQKKALSFMMKREQGWACDGSMEDLWAKEVDETGQLTCVCSSFEKVLADEKQIHECDYGIFPESGTSRLSRWIAR